MTEEEHEWKGEAVGNLLLIFNVMRVLWTIYML